MIFVVLLNEIDDLMINESDFCKKVTATPLSREAMSTQILANNDLNHLEKVLDLSAKTMVRIRLE